MTTDLSEQEIEYDADGFPALTGNDGICALPGCELAVPPPATSPDGRRKGGRPAKYCTGAHKDEAAARRRRALTGRASVGDPAVDEALRRAEHLAVVLGPPAADLVALGTRLADALQEITTGALATVQDAEEAVAQARRDAAEAVTRARLAEGRETAARAQAQADADAAATARRRERAARDDAERIGRDFAERIAEHIRLQGQAEGTRDAAQQARDDLAARLRADETARRQETAELRARLATLQAQKDDLAEALARAEAARAAAREETLTARADAEQAHAQAQTARREAQRSREDAAAQTAVAESVRAAAELTAAQARTDQAAADLVIAALERDRDAARDDANVQRERAATAEARAALAERHTAHRPGEPDGTNQSDEVPPVR